MTIDMMKVSLEPVFGGLRIYYYEKTPNGKLRFLDGKDWVEHTEGAGDPPHALYIGVSDVQDFLKQVESLGVKTDATSKVEGKLEATQYHLEDMRTLLKLKK